MFESERFKVPIATINALRAKYCDNCPHCKGRRLVEDSRKCRCVDEFNYAYALVQTNIPKKLLELDEKDLDRTFLEGNPGMSQIGAYNKKMPEMLEKGKGLFLQGENGSGKSFIATLILRKALKLGYSGYFILQRDLINAAFAALFDEDIRDDLETVICKIDFLVIDEIDKMFVDSAEKVQNLLEGLLKKRSYSGKPLIVTSNKALDLLERTLSKTIVSAFEEDLIEVTLIGNYRPTLQQQNRNLLKGDIE